MEKIKKIKIPKITNKKRITFFIYIYSTLYQLKDINKLFLIMENE